MKPSETPGESLTNIINRVFDAVNESKVGPIAYYEDGGKFIVSTEARVAYQRCHEIKAPLYLNQLALHTFHQILQCVIPHESVVEYKEPKGF